MLVESPLGKFIIHWKLKTKENVVRFGRTVSELTHVEIIIEAVKMDKIIEKRFCSSCFHKSRGKTTKLEVSL